MRILAKTSKETSITSLRACLALTLCAGIAAAQVWQSVTGRDDWPLSSYPMYSLLQSRTIQRYTLAGVAAQGEFELTVDHTSPWVRGRLRKLLADGFKDSATPLIAAICQNLVTLDAADISALRAYRNDWEMNSELEGMNDRGKLRNVVPVLCPRARDVILNQQHPGAPSLMPLAAPPGSLVFEAEELPLFGETAVVDEANAHKNKALKLAGPEASETPTVVPKASVRVEFDAPPGTYYVWLRAKADSRAPEASVWLQLDDEIGTKRGTALTKLTKPVAEYPTHAFAWVSKKPGYPPARIELQGSVKHSFLLSTREGKPVIDQVVFSTDWSEHPVHNLPLVSCSNSYGALVP